MNGGFVATARLVDVWGENAGAMLASYVTFAHTGPMATLTSDSSTVELPSAVYHRDGRCPDDSVPTTGDYTAGLPSALDRPTVNWFAMGLDAPGFRQH